MWNRSWTCWVVGALSACGGNVTPEPEVAEAPVSEAPVPEAPANADESDAASSAASSPATTNDAPAGAPRGKRAPCVLGQDQTCNGDPSVSALWGTCTASGTCECKPGFVLAPSGYCQPQQ